MVKVVVVDDHTLFRQAIVGQIQRLRGYKVVGETGSGVVSVRMVEELEPDVVVMDISLPDIDGIEAVRRIRNRGMGCKIILLSMYKYPELMDMVDSMGVNGYLLKNDAFEDLLYAIKAVLEGRRYVSPSLLEELPAPRRPSILSPFSEREKEIVCMIANGLSSREIAKELNLSIKTVETHRANIMKKMGARNVAEMIKQAVRWGVVT